MISERFRISLTAAGFACLIAHGGCAQTAVTRAPEEPSALVECTEPRPEICTREYRPVCARRDTGIRCVKAPCNGANEWATYGNGCDACSDEKVYAYREGSCEAGR